MKTYFLLTGMLISQLILGQEKPVTVFDTIKLEEVEILSNIVLSGNSVLGLYKTTDVSSLDKINSRLPGISTISRGAFAREPQINGLSSGQINIVIDGMKMFGACTDKMDPITSYVEPGNLSNLNLLAGTKGTKFGNSIGGTYSMNLLKPFFNSGKQIFYFDYGFETAHQGNTMSLYYNTSKNKWAYKINGLVKKYNEYTDASGNKVPFTQFSKANMHNSLAYKINARNIVRADFLFDIASDVGYPALPMDVSKARVWLASLEYSSNTGNTKLGKTKIKMYANQIYHVMDDSQRDSLYLIENKHTSNIDSVYMKMDMPGWSDTYGLFVEGDILHTANQFLFYRIDHYTNFTKADMTMFMNNLSNPGEPPMYVETWPENFRSVSGFYLNYEYRVNDKIGLATNYRFDFNLSKVTSDMGIREFSTLAEDIDKYYKKLNHGINIGAKYKPTKSSDFKVGFGYNERLPTLSEQFGFYLFNAHDGYDYLGNPNLKKETSINLSQQFAFYHKYLKLAWDNYFYRISNYIFGVYNESIDPLNLYASGTKQYKNLDEGMIFSSQFLVLIYPIEKLEINLISKYFWGNLSTGKPLPQLAPFKNIGAITYKNKSFFTQGEIIVSSPQHRINKNYGETSTPGFTLFNCRAGIEKKVAKSTVKLGVGVENLFNKTYREHLDWGMYNRPGRNFIITFSVKL